MSNYSKYKDRNPQDTILALQRILNEIGLFPVQQWTERSYDGARACRVTLHPTDYGANGKGTDELYATASAYGELIERLSNGILTHRERGDDWFSDLGFHEFPDERMASIWEIAAHPDPFCERMLPEMGCGDLPSKLRFLRRLSALYGLRDDTLPVVPFADPADGTIRWIPILFVHLLNASNGMAAGNTMEEAMVQGLSEIFERAACAALLEGRAVPPRIPEEEVRQYSFYRLIEQVHAAGRYRVTLLDCSMGKGWPVAGLCIADLEKGSFGIKLGAHPSFAVAVERSLTEALQGRNLESFASACQVGTPEMCGYYYNVTNVAKIGIGCYPVSLFTEKPDWEYRPWTRWEGLDNRGFLKGLLKLLKDEGLRPLVRDSSFLGFPCCTIAVPGFSHLFPAGETLRREIVTAGKARRSWDHFPDLSEEEEKRMLRLILFKEGSVRDNTVTYFTGRPLSPRFHLDRAAAFLSLKLGEFEQARRFFDKLARGEEKAGERLYLSAMSRYADLRRLGYEGEETLRLIRELYPQDTAERISQDTGDMASILRRQFPKLNCYDCAHCAVAGSDCGYPAVREMLIRTARAMKPENVDQEALLRELTTLWTDRDGEAKG